MTVVYLSNQNIRVLAGEEKNGKLVVERICETTVPEECLINGVITDEKILMDYLKSFWVQHNLAHKGVRLVVNSSQLAVKMLEIPNMKPDAIQEILKQEFADMERKQDPIFAYHVFRRTKTVLRILGTAAERSFVNSFFELFGQIGVEITAIHAALECGVRFLHQFAPIQHESCIVQLVDDNNLTSILWVDGRFENATRVRLFSENGTEAFGAEISRTVSHLMQFYASLRKEEPIRHVFIGGLKKADLPFYAQGVESLNLQVQSLDADGMVTLPAQENGRDVSDYVYLLGALLELKQNHNLAAVYQQKERGAASVWLKRSLPVGIAVLAGLVVSGAVIGSGIMKQQELDAVNAYVNDATNQEQLKQYDDINQQVVQLGRKMTAAEELLTALNSYPEINSNVVNAISGAAGGKVTTKIKSYTGEEGALTLGATASKPEDINGFIKELMTLAQFTNVEYSGYTYQENSGKYDINVVCYLSGDAGK